MGYYRLCRSESFQLIAQLDAHALGSLAADAGNLRQPRKVATSNGSDQVGRRHTAKDLYRQRRPNAADRNQLLKELLLFRSHEPVERERVLADMGVDVQRHF